ncbi:MAG: Prolyl endopeptidase [Lacunisphaera sp.]|nr:Prolyl endopeptidase [Lacunisphaera sp.]MDB6165034.1 Prolyl endopeptidase [Lacunisphaera sp.]
MKSIRSLILLAAAPALALAAWNYPAAKPTDHTDDYFGTKVADPFRWMEDVDAADTKAWVEGENKATFDFLAKIPQREAIKQRLMELLNYPRFSLPAKEGGKYFYTMNTGLQNQAPLYVKDTLAADGRMLLDPNTLAKDGTVALSGYLASEDGKWLLYGTAAAGSDWNEFRVRDVATGQDTADVIKWVKFSGMSWTHDNKGFFYSRYPEPPKESNATFSGLEHQKVYYHRLGTAQETDTLVFESPDFPKRGWGATITDDGRYLLLYGSEGTDPHNRLYYIDLKDAQKPDLAGAVVKLVDVIEATYDVIGNRGPVLFVRTDLDAPRQKIITIDLTAPDKANRKTLVPESKDVITSSAVVGGRLVVNYMVDARTRLSLFAADGKPLGEVPLPGIGTVAAISGRYDESELFFNFTSFIVPTANYRCDLAAGKVEVFQAPKVAFDPSLYETKQVFYASKDGTKIPMFITARKGLKLDGSHPTFLYAYGGFNISMQPAFSTTAVAWLEMGGVYAMPNLRGGGEYGRAWHEAGMKERKQNVFDDFAAAGDWLVQEGYTAHSRLVISGGSNGGLLIGATVNQRPDLARVALPAVGVMDMLRFQKFTIGWAWASDYGSSDDAAGFKYLSAYSPVHNVKSGVKYPAVLVTTGDHDDRVHPGHSFKYAAAMQAANPDAEFPTFIRIETRAGHGAGKPIAKVIEETADKLAFAIHFTGTGAN